MVSQGLDFSSSTGILFLSRFLRECHECLAMSTLFKFDSRASYLFEGTQLSMINALGLVANLRGRFSLWVSMDRYSSSRSYEF